MITSFSRFLLKTGMVGVFLLEIFLTNGLNAQWSSTMQLTTGFQSASPSILVDNSGNMYSIWVSNNGTNFFIQASTKPIATNVWSYRVTVSDPTQTISGPPVSIVDASSYFVVGWCSNNGTTTTAQVNVLNPTTGTWSGPTTLSNSNNNAYQMGIALNHAGNPFVYWTEFDGTYYTIQAAVFNP